MMQALAGGKPLSARAQQIARSREELLGLLANFPGGDSDRELSFSDLLEAKASTDTAETLQPPAHKDRASSLSSERQQAASKQQHQQAAAARERTLRRRRSDSRGSRGDGVLLNFYVPGLLTRSMTAPRPGRAAMTAGARQGAPATVAADKARIEAPLAVGCWPALWGRGRDRDRRNKPAKPAANSRDTRMPA